MKLGIEKTAMIRLRAGISYALTEAMDEGHCGLPTDQLIPLAEELLEVPRELILTALELERSDGAVIADKVGDTACMFLAALYRAEQAIADRVTRIVNGMLPWPWIDEEKALPWVERRSGLQLADSQKGAIRLALTAKALVITGGPGVGETTIVNSILKILSAKGVRLLLCAPTGRAAKRMTEATGLEAKTIHRLLEVDPKNGGFKRNADNSLGCDLLVVDEASMVDVMLMQALLKATPDNAALLIVGDIDQLPSVAPGQVLADIIGSGAVPVVRLTEVFRQAAASRIIINAHRINQGAMPDLSAPAGESDFYFVPAEDPETAVQRIVELVKTRIPKRFGLNPIRDIQVLCPMNRGGVGARSLHAAAALVAAEATEALSREHGMPFWRTFAELNAGWARGRLDDPGTGAAQLKEALAAMADQGTRVPRELFEALLAELEAEAIGVESALEHVDEALDLTHQGECRFCLAFLHRLRGDLLLKRNPRETSLAEDVFREAITVAKEQGARSYHLQAALPLAKLYQSTDRHVQAHAVLAPALEGFFPTPEMPEIAEAQALLVAIEAGAHVRHE
jgi:hypothetical protein